MSDRSEPLANPLLKTQLSISRFDRSTLNKVAPVARDGVLPDLQRRYSIEHFDKSKLRSTSLLTVDKSGPRLPTMQEILAETVDE